MKKAKQYKEARGKGGHVRANWKDATDIIAAQILYTIKRWTGSYCWIYSYSCYVSMISYASGARFINLLGEKC